MDRLGNVYIADYNHQLIRRVDTSGIITTVAGTGAPGFSGDGGPATSAQLDNPGGVAVDGLGNVYIADTYNYRIRRVDLAGVITTIAGNGSAGYFGESLAATSAQLYFPSAVAVDGLGNVYLADTNNHRIRRVDGNGIITTVAGNGSSGFTFDNVPATQAELLLSQRRRRR